MVYLLFGDIGWGQLTSPSGFEYNLAISYAEHQVIEGRPRLQYTGTGLGDVSLQFLFHADYCQPQRVWDQLVELATSHQAVPLSQGNGLLLGNFVLANLSRTTTYAAADGTLYGFECRLSLREYVDSTPITTKEKKQRDTAPAIKRHSQRPKMSRRKKEIPQLSAESKSAGYSLSADKKSVIRSSTRQS